MDHGDRRRGPQQSLAVQPLVPDFRLQSDGVSGCWEAPSVRFCCHSQRRPCWLDPCCLPPPPSAGRPCAPSGPRGASAPCGTQCLCCMAPHTCASPCGVSPSGAGALWWALSATPRRPHVLTDPCLPGGSRRARTRVSAQGAEMMRRPLSETCKCRGVCVTGTAWCHLSS